MSWYIKGLGDQIVIGLSGQGSMSITGNTPTHEPRPLGGDMDYDIYQRIGSSACSWSIYSNESLAEIDLLDSQFLKKAKDHPNKALACIEFFGDSEADLLGITIVLPKKSFASSLELFQFVLSNTEVIYSISLDFTGFKVPEATTETPTVQEFLAGSLSGKSYISNEVDFRFYRAQETA